MVESAPSDTSRIFFGAWITLENGAGEEVVYRIVGSDEFSPERGWISMDSPMAKALIKRTIDDEVVVRLPEGEVCYWVIDVRYEMASQ